VTESREFSKSPRSVGEARRFVTASFDWLPEETNNRLELLVSELATNAIHHGSGGFTVSLERLANAIRVEVSDGGSGLPVLLAPSVDRTSGRGLRIVQALSDEWGVRRGPSGKTVWFVLNAKD
jgi:anti-sigma regulatory factor (Ser/Thr protein kinase)